MEIILNHQPKNFDHHSELSVQQLLDEVMREKQKGIAVAIDNSVVPRSEWASRLIPPKSQVLIIKATQGG